MAGFTTTIVHSDRRNPIEHGSLHKPVHSNVAYGYDDLGVQGAENGLGRRLVRLGLPDVFAHGASRPYLMKEYGLDALGTVSGLPAEMLDMVVHHHELLEARDAPVERQEDLGHAADRQATEQGVLAELLWELLLHRARALFGLPGPEPGSSTSYGSSWRMVPWRPRG